MERVKAKPLNIILRQFLREEGLETPLNEYRVVSCWGDVMGEIIARHTADVKIRGGILYVSLRNPALRQNLLMTKSAIIQRLNDHVGAQVVQNIVFR